MNLEELAVEIPSAALRYDAEDAARSPPILGLIVRCQHLNFFDSIDVLGAHGEAACCADSDGQGSVDGCHVFVGSSAIDVVSAGGNRIGSGIEVCSNAPARNARFELRRQRNV